jgi:hypothetical protein
VRRLADYPFVDWIIGELSALPAEHAQMPLTAPSAEANWLAAPGCERLNELAVHRCIDLYRPTNGVGEFRCEVFVSIYHKHPFTSRLSERTVFLGPNPGQSVTSTLAPKERAIAAVPSVLPASRTTISSATGAIDRKHKSRQCASFRTMRTALNLGRPFSTVETIGPLFKVIDPCISTQPKQPEKASGNRNSDRPLFAQRGLFLRRLSAHSQTSFPNQSFRLNLASLASPRTSMRWIS